MPKATLILKDGTRLTGESFGADVPSAGEVVFNTGMMGYPESFSDPSYTGQIMTLTYPLIGNYGIGAEDKTKEGIAKRFESGKIHIKGLIVSEYSENYSHWDAKKSLGQWLKENNIPAISGIDTRALTQKIRQHGTILGKIIPGGADNASEQTNLTPQQAKSSSFRRQTGAQAQRKTHSTSLNEKELTDTSFPFYNPDLDNLVAQVSIKKPKTYERGKKRIICIDCGMKNNILRSFLDRDITVIRVPWNYDFITAKEKFDGIFLSNGPGDPAMLKPLHEIIRKAMTLKKPIFGICLGCQIMALATGAKTYKLKFGHRSQNQPCIDTETERCYITSQNHGFAVDAKSLKPGWKVWLRNANDQTVEGIKHKTLPFFSCQFHPEATPGPTDTTHFFDKFVGML